MYRSAASLLALVAGFSLLAPLSLVASPDTRSEKQTDPNERTESREEQVTSVCSARRAMRRHEVAPDYAPAYFREHRADVSSLLRAGIATGDRGFPCGICSFQNGCTSPLRC
jgi:hypothetical protein